MNKQVIFFGVNDWVKGLYEISKTIDGIDVAGFMVDDEYYSEHSFCGLPLWKSSTINPEMIEKYNFLLCVGYKRMRTRKEIYEKLSAMGCKFINMIHPSVTIFPKVSMGVNNIVLANATFEHNIKIGDNNVFCSQALITHDIVIGNHNFFSAQTAFAGNCEIGDLCYFGICSFTTGDLIIKNETYLVSGSGLFINTKESRRYMGNPASVVGSHKETGICITRKKRV